MLCEGDTSLVGDIDLIDDFYEDLNSKKFNIEINKGKGFLIIGCGFQDAEYLNHVIPQIAKTHGLSYFEPQNMTYIF